jgi:hypothetical protein
MKSSTLLSILSLFALTRLDSGAQTAPTPANPTNEVVQLSAFSVTTSKDTGYIASDTTTAWALEHDAAQNPQRRLGAHP